MKGKNIELLPEDPFLDEGDLPECWKLIELEELCTKITDGTHVTPKYIENGIPFISTSNIDPYLSGFDFSKYKKNISIEDHLVLTKRCKPEKGDLLISKCGTIGRTKLIDVDYEFSIFVGLGLIKLKKGVVSGKYLELVLNAGIVQKQLEELAPGSTRKTLPINKIGKIKIPLAPLSEQQRIVARVEALLAHVYAARDRLSRVPLIMKKFRHRVLAAACSGGVTKGWREENPSDVRVDQIYEKIQNLRNEKFSIDCESAIKLGLTRPRDQHKNKQSRNQVSDLPELPVEWKYYRLEDISHLITDGTHVTPKYQETGIPFLSVKNVRPFLIRDADVKHISQEEYNQINKRCNPEKNDILYTKVGATYGYAAINRLDYSFSIFVSLALIKPVKEYFSPEYAEIVMNSEIVFEQARERISGIGTPDLHLIEIRDFRIPLPPLAEQNEIVRRVGLLFKRADAIEQEVVAARRRCERLMQAVLGKAFRGELTHAGMAEVQV
jgi:type I restriction enzyme, S subunit